MRWVRITLARLKLVWKWRALGFRKAYAQTRLLIAVGYLLGTPDTDNAGCIAAIHVLFDAMERIGGGPC